MNQILDLTATNLKVVIINMSKEQTDPDQRDKGGCDDSMSSRERGGRKQMNHPVKDTFKLAN